MVMWTSFRPLGAAQQGLVDHPARIGVQGKLSEVVQHHVGLGRHAMLNASKDQGYPKVHNSFSPLPCKKNFGPYKFSTAALVAILQAVLDGVVPNGLPMHMPKIADVLFASNV